MEQNFDELSLQCQFLAEYANTPEMQNYFNRQVYEVQAHEIIKQLCQSKAVIEISQVGTTICNLCNNTIDSRTEKSINHFCQSSCHASCLRNEYEQKNPQFDQITDAYGGNTLYENKKNKAQQVEYKCIFCKKGIDENKKKFYQVHFCDKRFHNLCLQMHILDNNPNLDPGKIIECPECKLEFVMEQIWEGFGGKHKFQEMRSAIDEEFVTKMQLELKEQLSKEARERKFECEICMGENNINEDCRTLDHCLHQFCQDCLRDHIRASKNQGKIECPLCKDMPVGERKFPDPKHPKDYVHDPNQIEISIPIIKDLLPKDEFEKLEDLWTRKFYKTGNDKIILMNCPGFIKKDFGQSELDRIIEKKTHEKMLQGKLENLGFQFNNCTAMYELNIEDEQLNKYQCKACNLEFCPKCKDLGHNGTCEEYKKWKIENEKSDEALKELLENNKDQYKQCPKCKALIMKASGCNRIPCANKKCGAQICWICMEYFKTSKEGYSHIDKAHPGKLWT